MPENDDRRLCFVIGPIGPKRSPTRNHADYLLKHIIEPVLANEPFNYRVERADGGPPGIITTNIIMNTADAALVVADLTESNANAFYELGICHAFGVPAIHMIDKESPQPSEIPFDNLGYMTIVYSIDNPDDLKEAQNNLRKHAEEINKGDFKVVNPVSAALGLREAILSGDATQVQMAELLNSVSRLSGRISELESRGYVGRPDFFRTLRMVRAKFLNLFHFPYLREPLKETNTSIVIPMGWFMSCEWALMEPRLRSGHLIPEQFAGRAQNNGLGLRPPLDISPII